MQNIALVLALGMMLTGAACGKKDGDGAAADSARQDGQKTLPSPAGMQRIGGCEHSGEGQGKMCIDTMVSGGTSSLDQARSQLKASCEKNGAGHAVEACGVEGAWGGCRNHLDTQGVTTMVSIFFYDKDMEKNLQKNGQSLESICQMQGMEFFKP